MSSRIRLHSELVNILGSNNVYFQPPESIKMRYPAIVYSRSDINNRFANNDQYLQHVAYQVTVIDPNPDSDIVFRMSKFPTANFIRHFTSDNLNHDVFTIFYNKEN